MVRITENEKIKSLFSDPTLKKLRKKNQTKNHTRM